MENPVEKKNIDQPKKRRRISGPKYVRIHLRKEGMNSAAVEDPPSNNLAVYSVPLDISTNMEEVEIPIPQWMVKDSVETDPLDVCSLEQVTVKEEPVDDDAEMIWQDDVKPTIDEMTIKTPKIDVCDTFSYDACSFSSDSVNDIEKHLILHDDATVKHEETSISDNYSHCGFTSDKVKNIEEQTIVHSVEIKQEPECMSFSQENLSNVNETTLYTCNHCSFATDSVKLLEEHTAAHKVQIKLEPECTSSLATENLSDVGETYCGNTLFNCNQCSFASYSELDLEEHAIAHQVQINLQPDSLNFSLGNLSNAYETLCDDVLHTCSQCSFTSYDKLDFERHVVIHGENITEAESITSDLNKKGSNIEIECSDTVEKADKIFPCSYCDYKSTRSNYCLKIHVQMKHTFEKPQSCRFCTYKCVSVGRLKKHIISKHSKHDLLNCNFCSSTLVNEKHLKQHIMKNHANQGPYSCDVCKSKFNRIGNWRLHVKNHKKVDNRFCNVCSFKCFSFYDLEVHMMLAHNTIPLVCKLCDRVCFDKDGLKKHLETDHCKKKQSCCEFCNYKCSDHVEALESNDNVRCNNSFALNKHIMTQHTSAKLKTCRYCAYNYAIDEALQVHMSHEHSDKISKCNFCEYVSYSENVTDHIKIKHPSAEPFACTSCKFTCYNDRVLLEHSKKHTKVAELTCKVCDFVCTYRYMLKNHMTLNHSGKKLFDCALCEFKSLTCTGLYKHTLVNHTFTLLKCYYCGYICEGDILSDHFKNAHGKETSFLCSLCDFKCDNLRTFEEHVRSNMGVDEQCEWCDFKCNTTYHLSAHIEMKHKYGYSICNFCDYEYTCSKDFSNHLMKYHVNKVLKCKFCDGKFYDTTVYKDHVMEKHVIIKTTLTCYSCDFTTTNTNALKSHIMKDHLNRSVTNNTQLL